MITNYKVEVTNIYVDERYYSFNYKVWRNGELLAEDSYDSDHSWQDDKEGFKKLLKNNVAADLALENTIN